MCWSHVDVGDRFSILVTTFGYWCPKFLKNDDAMMSHRQVLANYGSYSVCSALRDVNDLNLLSPSSRPLSRRGRRSSRP